MAFSDPSKNISLLGLKEGERVADLGSGSGFYTLAAARLVGGSGRVFSVDVQKDLLTRIQAAAHTEHLNNIELVHGDIEEIGGTKLRDVSVDAAMMCNVLFQIENKENFLKEIKRILKSHGRVLIIDWAGSFGGLGPETSRVVLQADARVLFERHGFILTHSFDAGDHHYGLIYKKAD